MELLVISLGPLELPVKFESLSQQLAVNQNFYVKSSDSSDLVLVDDSQCAYDGSFQDAPVTTQLHVFVRYH